MDCVAKGIKKVLPKKLERGFQRFHESFYSHFDSPQLIMNGAVYCMNCKSTKENPVCPNCYAKEVAQWLGERSTRAAGKVMGMFSFGKPVSALLVPEAELNPEEEAGICDECGEYTEGLMMVHGEWVCEACGRYKDD